MANSLIADLLKTPRQVREEEQAQLQAKGIAAQNAILAQGTPSKSLFGGAMQGLAAQYAGYAPESVDTVKRNLMQLGGMDPRSAREQEAVEGRNIARVAMSGDIEKMEQMREALMRNPNVDPRALAALTQRIEQYRKTEFDREVARKGTYSEKLTAGDKQAIRGFTEGASKSRRESNKALNLAEKYATELPTGGFAGGVYSSFKKFIGSTDDIDLMRAELNNILNSGVIDALPDGPASDKDIENAKKGFPTEDYSAESLASFLYGYAKAQRIQAGYQEFAAQYISDNFGDSSGLNAAWRKEFAENTEKYWTDDSKSQRQGNQGGKESTGSSASSSTFDPALAPPGMTSLARPPSKATVNQPRTQAGASTGTMTVPPAANISAQSVPSMYTPRRGADPAGLFAPRRNR